MVSPLERWKGISGRESDGAGWDWGSNGMEIGGCSGEGLTPFWCTFAHGFDSQVPNWPWNPCLWWCC